MRKIRSSYADRALLQDEASIAVSFTGLMTAVTIFFVGALLSKVEIYDSTIKIPILFLILSTFGFLFATLIYANASGPVARKNAYQFEKSMVIGNTLSEYFGVYFLVFAIPLVILSLTPDSFLRISTLVIALAGLCVYHATGFSIMGRHFTRHHSTFLACMIALEISLYLTLGSVLLSYGFTLAMMLFILAVALSAGRKKQEHHSL